MTACTHLSDRMPEVALGGRWTADEEAHLAACEDCRAEWSLVLAASRLGSGLPPADPADTTRRVLERVRLERARSRARARLAVMAGFATAAVVALAVWVGRGGRGVTPGEQTVPMPAPVARTPVAPARPRNSEAPRAAPVEFPLPELDSLPPEVLDSILRTLDEPIAQVGPYDFPLGQSGDRELEQVLAGLEG
jgi:hypothetical protein